MYLQSPAHHHWGWPWLCFFPPSSPPLRLALDWELSSLLFLPPLLFLLWPAAGIQSDSDPKWSSSCCFSAGCCHGTVQSDLLYPSLLKRARAPSGRPPLAFSRSPLDSLLAGFLLLFLILDVALLHRWPLHLWDGQVNMVIEESLVSFFSPPFSLHPKSVWVASWRHYPLFFPSSLSSMCCSYLPSSSWEDTACTGDDFRDAYSLGATDCVSGFPPFGYLFYNGLAGPRYLLEKNFWEDSECRLAACFVLCFTRFHQVLGWSSCLALSNQQACFRPYCFTGRPRPIGTSFLTGSMVPSLWSAPSSFEIPALRVPRYRLAPVDCLLGSSVTGKAPC